jgi:SulP family sulfate permease
VTLIYGIVVVTIFNLDEHGVHIVGEIPAGLASPKLPGIDFEAILTLLPGAIAIALVAFAEAIGPARQFAAEHRYEIDADQELIAIGFANFGAGLFQGYPVGASLSKSAANENAGAKSSVSLLVAAAVTIIVALFLTPLFHNLPEATLAAIVIVAISGMMNVPAIRRYYTLRRTDFWLAIVALFAILLFEILVGLAIAVVLSLLILILRAASPKLSELGRHPGWLYFGDVDRHPEYLTFPGLVIVRPNEGVFFANATPLREAIMARVRKRETKPKAVIVDMEMTFEMDVPTVDKFAELKNELSRWQIDLYLTRVHEDVHEMLTSSGVADLIGPTHINQFFLDSLLQFLADQKGSLEYDQERVQKDLEILAELIEDMLMRVGDDEIEDFSSIRSNLRRISGDEEVK